MIHDLLAVLGMGIQILTAMIFLVAGYAKMRDGDRFAGILANFQLLPSSLTEPVAKGMPWLEMGLAMLLLSGQATPFAALSAAVMLVLFAGAMAINVRRGRRFIDCGCGDRRAGTPLGWGRVLRNLLLAGMLAASTLINEPATAWPLMLMGWGMGLAAFLLDRLIWAFADLMNAGARRSLPRG
jgi:uncharacterized membrane protein YphA (DoxX/SURF4 family)